MTELDSLKKKISEDPQSFIVIIGAGASIPAGLPSWKQLKDTLCASIREVHEEDDADKEITSVNNASSLWVAFSRLKSILGPHRYEKDIKQVLDIAGKKTPLLYKQIWELNVAGVVNFNIDNFAINSFSEVKKAAVDYATAREPHKYRNYPLSSNKFIFQPHGTISDSQSWVFTETDRQDLYFRNEDFKKVMAALFASKNLLIIGFNPEECTIIVDSLFLDLILEIVPKMKLILLKPILKLLDTPTLDHIEIQRGLFRLSSLKMLVATRILCI